MACYILIFAVPGEFLPYNATESESSLEVTNGRLDVSIDG